MTDSRDNDATDDEIAFHEAGHALVTLAQGGRIEYVTIEPDAERLGHVRYSHLHHHLPTLVARLRRDRMARWSARSHLLDRARFAAAGPVAEGLRRGVTSPPGWGVGGAVLWDAPSGAIPDTYGSDVENIYAAFRFIAGDTCASVGYEWRLLRELRAYFNARREVLRDLAVMLLRERTIPGEAVTAAVWQLCERRGVSPYDPLVCRSWWKAPPTPPDPTEEKTDR